MRVIAGSLRGRILVAPRGLSVRPTSDRVREALFDILGERVRGSRFLDLFAGSGAVGIEAFSRGAAAVVLVESSPVAHRSLVQNLKTLGISEQVRVIRAPWPGARRHLSSMLEPFSLVFADPPYRMARYTAILESVSQDGILCGDALVVLEHERKAPLPEEAGRLRLHRVAVYGQTALAFYQPGSCF